jgi:soluble lytic murein transglycosylase-like protein
LRLPLASIVIFSTFALIARADPFPSPLELEPLGASTPVSTALPAPAKPPAPAWDRDVPFAKHVRDAAKASNVRPELLHALIRTESNYQSGARSPAGALGLMQLMPGVLQRYNVRDPLDPRQNIHAGARYLRDLLDRFQDNMTLVLAAYNAGEHAVVRHGNQVPPFRQTRAFVPKVMALYEKLVLAAAGEGHPHE